MLSCLLFMSLLVDEPAWVDFAPKDGSFTARFPKAPVERSTRAGTVWQYAEKDRVYNVAKTPMPTGDNPKAQDVENALQAVRDNILKRVQAKLISEKTLKHRQYDAREYTFALPEEKGILCLRCFVAKGHVWEIKLGGPKDYVTTKEALAYLDSLSIK